MLLKLGHVAAIILSAGSTVNAAPTVEITAPSTNDTSPAGQLMDSSAQASDFFFRWYKGHGCNWAEQGSTASGITYGVWGKCYSRPGNTDHSSVEFNVPVGATVWCNSGCKGKLRDYKTREPCLNPPDNCALGSFVVYYYN